VAGAAVAWLAGLPVSAWAQSAPAPAASQQGPLNVFLDCNRCDDEHLRQNVGFIEYVRDRAVADLHVLVTTEPTGGGGLSWTLRFIGVGPLQSQDKTLSFNTSQTASQDDQRAEFARVFKLGLVGYVAGTAAAGDLDVTWKRPENEADPAADPWNYWVFRVGINGNRSGERAAKSASTSLSVSANRTTNNWKINLFSNANLRTNTFEIQGEKLKTETRSWNVNGRLVRSLGPKWSAGVTTSASHSSFSNTDRSFHVSPAIEYDFFPYSESSRRSLVVHYAAGFVQNQYAALTIFDKLSETIPKHYLNVSLTMRQPWGSLEVASRISQQLNHRRRHRETIFGNTDLRLFKGFSLNMFAEFEKIADQISLEKEGASETEILLRLQQLQTNYSYFLFFGVSYSFGSIFNSIVNTRFPITP
jgi:hypothetical protein